MPSMKQVKQVGLCAHSCTIGTLNPIQGKLPQSFHDLINITNMDIVPLQMRGVNSL
jgi:hypothetical protein